MEDKDTVDLIAVAAVFIVLLFATRSLTLHVILVMVIETAIWVNFSTPYFTGKPEFYISYLLTSTIQLGVTVDYAILFADRYKEERRRLRKTEAVRATVEATTVPVLTSGTVLAVTGGLMGAICTHGILSQLGWFLCTGVVLSLSVVVFVLPGFLWMLDWLIGKTTWKAGFISNRCTPEAWPRRLGRRTGMRKNEGVDIGEKMNAGEAGMATAGKKMLGTGSGGGASRRVRRAVVCAGMAAAFVLRGACGRDV